MSRTATPSGLRPPPPQGDDLSPLMTRPPASAIGRANCSLGPTLSEQSEEQGWATAKTLAEALPYIQIYDRETVVIKYGGHAMGEDQVAKLFAADAVLLKMLGVYPVVVHGGGPQISAWLSKAGVKSTFVDGLRVTDEATMEVAEMVLSGAINKEISSWITQAGAEAGVRGGGLSGKDARLVAV